MKNTTNTMDSIVVSGLTKQYRGCLALDGVSFTVRSGSVVGLVGQNGAGKTTLIRVLCGLANQTAGTYEILGTKNSEKASKLAATRKKMACMVETPALYETMTPRQNMLERCLMLGMKMKDAELYIHERLDFVGLPGAYTDKRKAKSYSLGMRQRLGIAMSLIGDPELLILDEPTNGLDPEGIKQIRDLLVRLNEEKGTTIIVSSHILSELSKFAEEYIFLEKGRLLKSVSAEEIEASVGKMLILKTSDNEKALSVLTAKGYSAKLNGDSLVVKDIKEVAEVLNVIQQNGISLVAMRETENSLEDYFLDLLRGKNND